MSQLPRPKELNDRSPSRFRSKLPNLQGAPNHDPVILLEQDKVFLDLNADERDELGSEEAVEILEVVGERVREAEEETQVLGAQLHRGETPLWLRVGGFGDVPVEVEDDGSVAVPDAVF